MRLKRENNQSAEYKSLRGKSYFRIVGKEDEGDIIRKIDDAIGAEIKCFDAADKPYTWYNECNDYCAEYQEGQGSGWFVDHDDVEEFKALWKKYKNMCK